MTFRVRSAAVRRQHLLVVDVAVHFVKARERVRDVLLTCGPHDSGAKTRDACRMWRRYGDYSGERWRVGADPHPLASLPQQQASRIGRAGALDAESTGKPPAESLHEMQSTLR